MYDYEVEVLNLEAGQRLMEITKDLTSRHLNKKDVMIDI